MSAAWPAPVGCRFPCEVIAVAVRWYLRHGLSYRDVEELLAERGIEVDHVTIYRWMQIYTPEFIDAARPVRHATGDRWFVAETYVKLAGRWTYLYWTVDQTYLYWTVDQHGQVIDVLVCQRRDGAAARTSFARAQSGPSPVEVTTDRAAVHPRLIDEILPAARHVVEQYANNGVEADHGRLQARLRPMRGLKTIRSLRTVAAGHAVVQNLRRGHYQLTAHLHTHDRVRVAFAELAFAI